MLSAAVLVALMSASPRTAVSASPPPVVLMIRSATTPEAERRERKLFDELGFALDGFMLMSAPTEAADFSRLPLAGQITAALPIARENDAMAVVWMSFPLSKQVMLHLVALGSGRTFVRTIETDRTTASEANLALIARELLGTAYLFETPATLPSEVKEVVRAVKQQIPPEVAAPVAAPSGPLEKAPGPWQLVLDGALRYPLLGGVDAVPVLHLRAGVGRRFANGFEATLQASAGFAEVARSTTNGARFWLGGATLGAFRGFSFGPLLVGPKVTASMAYATFLTSSRASANLWLPEIAGGVFAKTLTSSGPTIGAGVFVSWAPIGGELRSGADVPLYRTPTLELTLALTLSWEGL